VSPRPTAAVIGRYYPSDYACHATRDDSGTAGIKRLVYDTFFAEKNALGAIRPLLKVLLFPIRRRTILAFRQPSVRRVFEFGAGSGNDLVVFRSAGWELSGCEPSEHACRVAAERGVLLQCCQAEAAEIAPDSVSCVLLNNVFEHLHDPARVLDMSRHALVQDGVLVLIIPNHASWAARLFGAAWPAFDAPRHLWGFSPRSVKTLLGRHGFKIEYVDHQSPGRWFWQGALDGRTAAAPVAEWRRGLVGDIVALAMMPLGMIAALLRHGDFIKVVARKAN
jgi:SAM-dependent methyltransferase